MRNGNNNFKRIQAAGLAGILMAGLSVVGLPAELVSAVNGWEVDLNAGGTAEASSVSITMGGGTANGQLSAGSTDPNKSAGLVKRTASVEIGATDGYTVTLSGNPNLTGVNGSNKIPTVTSNTTLAQMNNQWGWYTAEGNVDCSALQTMKQMKSTGDQIATGTLNAKTTKQFTMCFGAKVNGNQAADTYSNTVTLSVVAQPKVTVTFGGITTMQAMTSDICKAASVNDTAYLRDTRDNKSYWVTKLADGNCWMSQNLDLDITTSNVKAADSDVTSDWNSSSSYPPVTTYDNSSNDKLGEWSTSSYGTYSWTFGDYVINAPNGTAKCDTSSKFNLAGCSMFTIVGNRVASTDPNFYRLELYEGTDGSTCTKSKNTAISVATSGPCAQYDAHYLVGNYYQYTAAAAGTILASQAGNATGSVCPKNWKLPNSGKDEQQLKKGSFNYMLMQYGLANANGNDYGSTTGTGGDGYVYNTVLSPLFFVRSGTVDPGMNNGARIIAPEDPSFNSVGAGGYYWSSRSIAYGSIAWTAYGLSFSNNTGPATSIGTANGNNIRCVVSTLQ